jgi:hypothetical protein
MIPQISYNVLIDRFRAFAEAHFLIKGFSHGDLSNIDIEKDVEFPWMHVLPVEVEPRSGTRLYSFVIIFADLPRDKETPTEYQRECISDCIKLAEDLLAEVQNGQIVFGPYVELDGGANIEVFINEFSHTLVGVNLQLTLSVPWDWSACDIPADFTIGGSGSGGEGVAVGITLQTNGVNNGLQSLLNLQEGTNVTIVDNGNGTVTINSSGGGGGGGTVTSVGLSAPSAFNVSGSPVTTSGTLTLSGAGTSGDYIDGTGALQTFPTIPTLTSELTNDSGFITAGDIPPIPTLTSELTNDSGFITIGDVPPQVNSDWNAVGGVAEILNKPAIPSAQGLQDVITTDPQLTTDNTIDGSNQQIEFINFGKITLLSNNKLDIYSGNTGLTATTTSISVGAEDGTVQSNISFDVNGSIMQSIDGADFTAVTTEPNALKIATPNIAGGSATVGQVLTLSNAATGEVEFTTVGGGGTVTSVGLTMPTLTNAAYTVAGSPVTTSGTLAVTANGTIDQYIDGTGALRTLPSTGGGGGQIFYFNGNTSQGTIAGNTYYQLGTAAGSGATANFTRATTGVIARFITNVGSPNHLILPSGVWTIDVYLSETGGGANHAQILAKLYTYNGSTFTLIGTSPVEEITNGNVVDLYTFGISVPNTVTAATDRIHIEFDIQNTNGKTVTLYTEASRIGEVHTTYAIGISSLNGLTESTQNFAVGTAGSDFAISSAASTHTFNLPTASAANRGALSSADWSTFNGKQNSIGLTTVGTNLATLPDPSAVRYLRINADNTVSALTLAQLKTDLSVGSDISVVLGSNVTNVGTGFEDVTGLSFAVTANKTYKWRATISYAATAAITISSNGPATSLNNARFTTALAATTNVVSNQTSYDAGANTAASGNGLSTADGIFRVTASGTWTIRFRCATAGLFTIRAGSVLEYSEVL